MTSCRVVAVNAGKLWREFLERLFADTRFVLQPEGEPVSTMMAPLQAHLPDAPVVFLYRDVSAMGNCIDWIKATRAQDPGAKIIVMVSRLRLALFVRAMQAGADGFLTDDMSGTALVQSLELAVAGEKVLPGLLAHFIARRGIYPLFRDGTPDTSLLPRESDILKRLAQGQSNKAIANVLGISESTVKSCVKAILRKIAAQNRTQAAVWALNEGLTLADQDEELLG